MKNKMIIVVWWPNHKQRCAGCLSMWNCYKLSRMFSKIQEGFWKPVIVTGNLLCFCFVELYVCGGYTEVEAEAGIQLLVISKRAQVCWSLDEGIMVCLWWINSNQKWIKEASQPNTMIKRYYGWEVSSISCFLSIRDKHEAK